MWRTTTSLAVAALLLTLTAAAAGEPRTVFPTRGFDGTPDDVGLADQIAQALDMKAHHVFRPDAISSAAVLSQDEHVVTLEVRNASADGSVGERWNVPQAITSRPDAQTFLLRPDQAIPIVTLTYEPTSEANDGHLTEAWAFLPSSPAVADIPTHAEEVARRLGLSDAAGSWEVGQAVPERLQYLWFEGLPEAPVFLIECSCIRATFHEPPFATGQNTLRLFYAPDHRPVALQVTTWWDKQSLGLLNPDDAESRLRTALVNMGRQPTNLTLTSLSVGDGSAIYNWAVKSTSNGFVAEQDAIRGDLVNVYEMSPGSTAAKQVPHLGALWVFVAALSAILTARRRRA